MALRSPIHLLAHLIYLFFLLLTFIMQFYILNMTKSGKHCIIFECNPEAKSQKKNN